MIGILVIYFMNDRNACKNKIKHLGIFLVKRSDAVQSIETMPNRKYVPILNSLQNTTGSVYHTFLVSQ